MSPSGEMTSTSVPVNAASAFSSASASVNISQLHAPTRSEVPSTNAPKLAPATIQSRITLRNTAPRCLIPSWATKECRWFRETTKEPKLRSTGAHYRMLANCGHERHPDGRAPHLAGTALCGEHCQAVIIGRGHRRHTRPSPRIVNPEVVLQVSVSRPLSCLATIHTAHQLRDPARPGRHLAFSASSRIGEDVGSARYNRPDLVPEAVV